MIKTNSLQLLMEEANKKQGTLLVEDKDYINTLARELGLNDITVIDFDDLHQGRYYLGQPFFIYELDKTIKNLFQDAYGLNLCGYSEVE